jgi:SAM-dependent methyltransferase
MTAHDHDAIVRGSFQQQVGLFAGDDSPFRRRPASVLSWIEPLDADMIVLEVACGAAHVAEVAAPHVRQVVGIDLTPELIALGAQRLVEANVKNVLLQEGNAAALPFVDASFDLVMCRASVHHFADPETSVAEMARVCRRGGRVVVSDLITPSPEVRDAFDAVHRCIDPSHRHAFTESELAALVEHKVGAITYGETTTLNLALDVILTDAADREAAIALLRADMERGVATGFRPTEDDHGIEVSFMSTTVHGTRGA